MLIVKPELEVLLQYTTKLTALKARCGNFMTNFLPSTLRFLICEDGSVDNTKEILCRLSEAIPMRLILSKERKGYSRAVKDGMTALEAPYLLCLDSDGQCDPKDSQSFGMSVRNRCRDRLARTPADSSLRKLMSRTFYRIYQLLYHVPAHDPSCPYVLANKKVVDQLVDEVGSMQQVSGGNLLPECIGTVLHAGAPVNHCPRSAGTTQVYKFHKLRYWLAPFHCFVRHMVSNTAQ